MIRKVMGLALPVVAFLVGAGAGDFLKGDGDAGASAGAHATAEGPGGMDRERQKLAVAERTRRRPTRMGPPRKPLRTAGPNPPGQRVATAARHRGTARRMAAGRMTGRRTAAGRMGAGRLRPATRPGSSSRSSSSCR